MKEISMSQDSTGPRYRVAVVGAGPSGFYSTELLLKSDAHIGVDVYDRLPYPFGLVRYGVAPDHQKIKNVTRVFDQIAALPNFRFFGNVEIGRNISLENLREHYSAVIIATGAESDIALNVKGDALPGVLGAREFVGWYNGHPDNADCNVNLDVESAVIIGQGNVAADVARILLSTPEALAKTDISTHALHQLRLSKIRRVHVVGRRGPVQAKFTPNELRDLLSLPEVASIVNSSDLELGAANASELESAGMERARTVYRLLSDASNAGSAGTKKLHLRFQLNPVEFAGTGKLEAVRFEKTQLIGPPFAQRAISTGEIEDIPCGLLISCAGFRSQPVAGLPFNDATGAIVNVEGRVDMHSEGAPVYVVGWAKRGPTGVVGTNREDAIETVGRLLNDLPMLEKVLGRGVPVATDEPLIMWKDWSELNRIEIERGRLTGKVREKFIKTSQAFQVLQQLHTLEG